MTQEEDQTQLPIETTITTIAVTIRPEAIRHPALHRLVPTTAAEAAEA